MFLAAHGERPKFKKINENVINAMLRDRSCRRTFLSEFYEKKTFYCQISTIYNMHKTANVASDIFSFLFY